LRHSRPGLILRNKYFIDDDGAVERLHEYPLSLIEIDT